MKYFLLAWLLLVASAGAIVNVIKSPAAAAGGPISLDTTGVMALYFVDAAASGTGPTQLDDDSGNGQHMDVNGAGLVYSTSMTWTEIAGDRGLSITDEDGSHEAWYRMSDPGCGGGCDALRTFEEATDYTYWMTMVVRVQECAGGGGRVFAVNVTTSSPALGVTCSSTTEFSVWLNQTEYETFNPGTTDRMVLSVKYDLASGTANDRIRVWVNGSELANGGSNPAQNLNKTWSDTADLWIAGRGPGSNGRSFTSFADAFCFHDNDPSAAQITNHYDRFIADGDGPA